MFPVKQIELEPIDFREAGDRKKARRRPPPWEIAAAGFVVGIPLLFVFVGAAKDGVVDEISLVALGLIGGVLIGLGLAKLRHRRP